ncbi:MADS-box protein FBP24 isoform X2 [Castanea sativa]|uniref:MADS-box protein FBP24 isoform X2 n=1 Tax=Castanea sativa TaxID=21020 RepID=UPI003F64DBA8
MGRRRVSISRIENRTTRHVTFAKRRVGLFKKTHELSVLCDAQIGIVVFSSSGKLYEYCSDTSGMEHIIRRYKIATGTDQIPESNDQLMHGELKRMQRETLSLELNLQRYTGEDLNSVQFGDLHELEEKLENSVNKVRERMFELLQQQIDNLRRKGKMLHDENEHMCHLIQLRENQVALEHQAALDQHQQMAMVAKTEDRRRVLESFPFSVEEQPSCGLPQVPPIFNPYRLQPTQPNLQDFSLHLPDYV